MEVCIKIDNVEEVTEIARLCRVAPGSVQDVYACTPIQEALMAASIEIINSYVLQMVSQLNHDIDLEEFKKAWQKTALANAILRTRIVQTAGSRSCQVVVDEHFEWSTSDSLDSYLKQDIILPMTYGSRLWRYGIVSNPSTQERFFIWTAHHAVCDGYALSELLKRVGLQFKKLSPPSAPPYKEFIDYLNACDKEKEEQYWRKELGASSSLHFPAISGSIHRAVPSCNLTRDIHIKWPEGLKVSKALILQSAWAVLISRYTRSQDVTFPTVSSGRTGPMPGIRQITGPVFAVVPISFKIDPSQTIGEFFMSAYLRHKGMARFEQTGLATIRRYLGHERARICDFRNLLVVQPGNFTDLAIDAFKYLGMNILKEYWRYETHSYPLVTTLTYTPDGFHLRFDYDPQIIHPKEIFNFASQYEEIVRQFCVSDTTRLIGSISALSAADEDQIFAWNVSSPIPKDTFIHDLVTKQAFKTPNAPALCSREDKLTYEQVDDMSSDLAFELVDAGVQPTDLIAMLFEKSIWALVSIVAILKTGAVYVPLDPAYPKARLQEIIDLTGARFAVTSPRCAPLLQGLCSDIILFHGSNLSRRNLNSFRTLQCIDSSATAYILFTSGSTGKPKGVVVQHSAICTSIIEHGRALGFSPDWRVLQFSSYAFDVSLAEMFTTLAFGGCVCVPSDDQRVNDLSKAIRDLNVNVALLTPTVATLVIPEEVPALETLILGGEATTQEQVDRWRGYVRVANGFGPTETSVYCSVNVDLLSSNAANIGIRIGGHNWIVDPENYQLLTPVGCVGELVVSGPSIAKEYFGNKIQTEAVFMPAPSWLAKAGHSSTRVYKTGDLVRYTADGTMEFVGRKDTQVKLRGFRIELGEVESRVLETANFRAVTALAPKTGFCNGKLLAIVCLNSQFSVEVAASTIDLDPDFVCGALSSKIASSKAYLASILPDYMVPSVWIVLWRFPISSSGKLNREKLMKWVEGMSYEVYQICSPSIEDPASDKVNDFTPESLISELRLAWSYVLNVPIDSIKAGTTFFSLGGDSISAMQIVTRCKNTGINTSVKDILLCQSLSNLHLRANRVSVTSKVEYEPANTLFELSPVQKMFFSQNESITETGRYNQAFKARLLRNIDVKDLIAAFDAVVEKHPMLRARFVNEAGWRQFYCALGEPDYRIKIHGSLAKDEIDKVIEEAHASIDILKGPTFSVDIFNSEESRGMFIMAHHLVVDLVSWRVILQDIEDFLNTGTMSPATGFSFSLWCRALKDRFTTASGSPDNNQTVPRRTKHDFWGLSIADNSYGNAKTIIWNLDSGSTQLLLQQGSHASRVTSIDLMVAAIVSSFRQVFHGMPVPEVFIEGHGREPWASEIDIGSVVGWFTTMYPITNFPPAGRGIKSLLQHVVSTRKSFPDNGLEHFSRSYLNSNDDETQPLREILLNYQGLYQQLENQESLFKLEDVVHTPVGSSVRRNALFEMEARIQNNCLEFSFAYNKKSQHQEDIRDWAQKIKTSFSELCFLLSGHQAPQSVGDFMMLDDMKISRLDGLLRRKIGGSDSVIEDIVLCSRMQSHILQTQLRDPSFFTIRWGIEVSPQAGHNIDLLALEHAWTAVVRKHHALRSIFLVDPSDEGTILQVVLEDPQPPTSFRGQNCEPALTKPILPHKLTLSMTLSGSAICQFEACHAILDAFSLRLMMRDFLAAYQNRLSSATSSALPFRDTTMRINILEQKANKSVPPLSQRKPCILSPLHNQPTGLASASRFTVVPLTTLERAPFQTLHDKHTVTLSSLIDATWARTLATITSQSSVTFGYISSNRTPEASEVVGPMIEVFACFVEDAGPGSELMEIASQIQQQKIEKSESVQHWVYGSNEQRGFNTAISFQEVKGDGSKESVVGEIRVTELGFEDPWDFDVFVRVFAYDNSIDIRLEFDNTVFGVQDRQTVIGCFEELLHNSSVCN